MPPLVDEQEQKAFSEVWKVLLAITKAGGITWAGLVHDPLSVRRHANGRYSFAFDGGIVMGTTPHGLLIVTPDVVLIYAEEGHLRDARLNDDAQLPVEQLAALAQQRAPHAQWS
jgi:hypothetical protein